MLQSFLLYHKKLFVFCQSLFAFYGFKANFSNFTRKIISTFDCSMHYTGYSRNKSDTLDWRYSMKHWYKFAAFLLSLLLLTGCTSQTPEQSLQTSGIENPSDKTTKSISVTEPTAAPTTESVTTTEPPTTTKEQITTQKQTTTEEPAATQPTTTTKKPAATQPTTTAKKPAATQPQATTKKPAVTTAGLQQEVFQLVNAERKKQGLSALRYCSEVQKAADIRAKEIVKTFAHTRPDGRSCFTVFDDLNLTGYWGWGENIAYGYPSSKAVMNGWMNSDGHRANILKTDFTGIAVGVYANSGTYYWVQLFVTD